MLLRPDQWVTLDMILFWVHPGRSRARTQRVKGGILLVPSIKPHPKEDILGTRICLALLYPLLIIRRTRAWQELFMQYATLIFINTILLM